jgi:hypothetical protein
VTRPDYATLDAAVLDAREALAAPPADRARRLATFAAYASRLVLAERPCRPGLPEHPLAAEGRELRARLQAAFDVELGAQRAERDAVIAAHRRQNEAALRRG